jgi:hypothetical protein
MFNPRRVGAVAVLFFLVLEDPILSIHASNVSGDIVTNVQVNGIASDQVLQTTSQV